jgi:hypothetical protein
MNFITLSGRVSGINEQTNNNGWYSVSFRINNRAVGSILKTNLVEGDVVTVVADDLPEPNVVAVRNESTKLVYQPDEPKMPGFPLFGLAFGLLLVPFLIGVLLLWMSWTGYQSRIEGCKRDREIRRLMAAAPVAV